MVDRWNLNSSAKMISPQKTNSFVKLSVLLCGLAMHSLTLFAQVGFAPVFIQTDATHPFLTATSPVPVFSASEPRILEFEFGFATDEVSGPGVFFDSATITLQDLALNYTLVIATADAVGFVWAPVTPGTLVFNPNLITNTAVEFPSVLPILNSRIAYRVIVPIPSQFAGQQANVYVDLANNLNAINSIAYFKIAGVAVPEPTTTGMFALGAFLLFWAKRPK